MMVVDNKFEIGQLVYLKTDPDQFQRMLTGIQIRSTGLVYELSQGANVSSHYDYEINSEKEFVNQ